MNASEMIAKIEELAKMYSDTGNRMVLTTLRQLTTKMMKQSGGALGCKLFDEISKYFDPRLVGLKEL